MYPEMPAVGERVGTITLPSLDESWPIYQGTTRKQLSDGVGHFLDSVLPGVADNSVLSGNRTTVFARLGELVVGDLIHIQTSAGEFTYQVRELQVVPQSSHDVIVPTPTAVLTLTTAYPFTGWSIATDVFVVSADLVSSKLSDDEATSS
jgi:sortase A